MSSTYYREKAERCRLMLALALVPEIKEQLRLWAHEFDDLAETTEKREARRQKLRDWRNRMRRAFRRPATT